MGGPGGQPGGDYPFHPVELINIPVGSSAVGDITAQVSLLFLYKHEVIHLIINNKLPDSFKQSCTNIII